jgi:hypothetical protein
VDRIDTRGDELLKLPEIGSRPDRLWRGGGSFLGLGDGAGKALLEALAGLDGFDVPVPGRPCDGERADQVGGGNGDVVDRTIEDGLVGARRALSAAELAHELEGSGADLVVAGGRLVVGEAFNAAAHSGYC